ncbi:MAG: type II toxin-antitoxin system RelE/ParE family toxin [Slackia sp.]|nr:type II toxin-antitoxin system RelE/ParE family toxin [Slackia sp.]
MPSIRYRPLAMRDKRAIASYIALDLRAPHAASSTIRAIDDAIETLKTIPAAGRIVDDMRLECGPYRKLAAANYWIFYSFNEDGNTIVIERILHQRQSIAPQMYDEIDSPN